MNPEEHFMMLAVDLATVAGQNTVSAIGSKIKAVKSKNNDRETINTMEEIINNLITDKNELERISLDYKGELERSEISDDDIKYLHNSIKGFLLALDKFNDDDGNPIFGDDVVDPFLDLISVDTLRTMQLLGYNYKEAIGIPLTKLTSEKIMKLGSAE